MLTVVEAIRERRSIRSFRSYPVPEEVIRQILEAARLAPSGTNRQPWRFIVVTDAAERAKLRQMCWDQAFIEEAPVVFVCCADLTAYSRDVTKKRYQQFVDYGIAATLSGGLTRPEFWGVQFEQEEKKGMWAFLPQIMSNTFIAVEHMVLMATALGLGSCWVAAISDMDEMRNYFGLSPTTVVVAVLPVGYPKVVPPPRPRLSMSEILLRPISIPNK